MPIIRSQPEPNPTKGEDWAEKSVLEALERPPVKHPLPQEQPVEDKAKD